MNTKKRGPKAKNPDFVRSVKCLLSPSDLKRLSAHYQDKDAKPSDLVAKALNELFSLVEGGDHEIK